jgi:hypothetical protein
MVNHEKQRRLLLSVDTQTLNVKPLSFVSWWGGGGCKPRETPTGNLVSKVEDRSGSRTSRSAKGTGDDYKFFAKSLLEDISALIFLSTILAPHFMHSEPRYENFKQIPWYVIFYG